MKGAPTQPLRPESPSDEVSENNAHRRVPLTTTVRSTRPLYSHEPPLTIPLSPMSRWPLAALFTVTPMACTRPTPPPFPSSSPVGAESTVTAETTTSPLIENLLAAMTLREKIGQLVQRPGGRSKSLNSRLDEAEFHRVRAGEMGSSCTLPVPRPCTRCSA